MELKRLLSLTRQAIDDYKMINEGDKIAVGISGGKDSITLLYALSELRRFYPKSFELMAVTVDVGLSMDFSPIQKLCNELGVEYSIVKTSIKQIVFDEKKEQNPCSLCAKMRKGALNDELKRLGFNKVAYGHHKDDFISTMFLSLMYEGRFQSLDPSFTLDKTGVSVIRPLMYVSESEVIGFVNRYNLPIVKSTCPADGNTKRKYVEDMLAQMNRDNPGVKDRLFSAIKREMSEQI